jgi:hypothetical protein
MEGWLSRRAAVRIAELKMAVPLRDQAERAIGSVVEASCPLCPVELRLHDLRACCPCCGDSYRAGAGRLEVQMCAEHGRDCEHSEASGLNAKSSRPDCCRASLGIRQGV